MAYRSDDKARIDRRSALERSLQHLDSELKDLEPLQAQRDQVRGQLDAIRQDEEVQRKRAMLPVLRRVTVTTPCRENWDRMKGDDRVRFCGRCDKNVFNISAMTPQQANNLLDSQPAACVRFFRRSDGTIVSGDCAGGVARRKRNGRLLGLAGLAALAGAAIGIGSAANAVQGKMEVQGATEQQTFDEVQGGVQAPEHHADVNHRPVMGTPPTPADPATDESIHGYFTIPDSADE